jgi:hypothetical protein
VVMQRLVVMNNGWYVVDLQLLQLIDGKHGIFLLHITLLRIYALTLRLTPFS